MRARIQISIEEIDVENFEKFPYLGNNVTYEVDCSKEISVWIATAKQQDYHI